MKIFISWSGKLSKKLAKGIHDWLPKVIQRVKPYFTPDDIEKGSRWESSIIQELQKSSIGIICITPENMHKPWMIFEAGALACKLEKSNVCTVLFNLKATDITGPLAMFQATHFAKSEFRKLLDTINNHLEDERLDEKTIGDVFDKWWPELEAKLNETLENHAPEPKQKERKERDILEEVLTIVRSTSRALAKSRLLEMLSKPKEDPNSAYIVSMLGKYGTEPASVIKDPDSILSQLNRLIREYLQERQKDPSPGISELDAKKEKE